MNWKTTENVNDLHSLAEYMEWLEDLVAPKSVLVKRAGDPHHPQHELAAATLARRKNEYEVVTEVVGWLYQFNVTVANETPTKIAHSLVQLGVEVDQTCSCAQHMDSPLFVWLHANHQVYNRVVRSIINSKIGLLAELRLVLQKDLEAPEQQNLPGYGNIVLKKYGRLLLDHFLSDTPDPSWVSKASPAMAA